VQIKQKKLLIKLLHLQAAIDAIQQNKDELDLFLAHKVLKEIS
jgi:hypothetical protein